VIYPPDVTRRTLLDRVLSPCTSAWTEARSRHSASPTTTATAPDLIVRDNTTGNLVVDAGTGGGWWIDNNTATITTGW
jgi:hypothetical protein